ncbi:hypothetical protein K469DRAFT_730927 [Zopfia rhizophila CBS 207.26]|uniref:Phosphoglycerate mutase-like protein n=1 Tax=Zopfia rhizophila CBS 207.26 TaxID=1314779 RepID=A0A6A6EJN7_9PEZI|nr:hypothetical protein K469DRAFT_730927 [Zopfia rhizophila CBS 207.26]
MLSLWYIIHHGQSLHNVDRGYPHKDPPLTDAGQGATKQIKISAVPDLIVVSLMTRTIQTAMNAFPLLLGSTPLKVDCPEEWDHPPHTIEGVTARAEAVRQHLKELPTTYKNIAVETHRGFIASLVKGGRHDVCDTRSYRFATEDETQTKSLRIGINCDTQHPQDFGPTVLTPHKVPEALVGPDTESFRTQGGL